ncbi:MAG: GNAT family N-acetyltransferase [Alphaproteobacteria bacterium]
MSRDIEFDGLDDRCRHYLALIDAGGLGTARARPIDDREVKLERVAVRAEHRHHGIGRQLMIRALADARKDGFESAMLNSQVQACPFYEKLGFRIEGDQFLEAGIPHRRMRILL